MVRKKATRTGGCVEKRTCQRESGKKVAAGAVMV